MTKYGEWNGPVKAEPDFDNLLMVLKREKPHRPTLFEFFLNEPLYRRLAGVAPDARLDPMGYDRTVTQAFRNAGYDYATLHGSFFTFPHNEQASDKTLSLNEGFVIRDRPSFEAYAWPDPATFDYGRLDIVAREMPPGQRIVVYAPSGVLENTIRLLGYDNLCFMSADDPELLRDVVDAVGSRILKHYEIALQCPRVGAIIGNDDWGFKTQTMISPADMRQYIIPWHRKIVKLAHEAGRPAIMHSCGQLSEVMNDIIDDIGYDGKHSYEDGILPVEQAYEQYGRRMAILGGLDVDFVIRSTPEQVYRRAKAMIERSSERGGYGLGTGNSVPEYVPDAHYFAMISAVTEGR